MTESENSGAVGATPGTGKSPTVKHTALSDDVANPDLELGHLSQAQVIGLSISSFIPAVGLATVPAFVVASAGRSSWLAMVIGVVTFIIIAALINVFARRYVGTGSLYSYVHHVFGRWSQIAVAAALVPGYIVAVASVVVAVGVYAGSFLVSLGVDGAGGHGWQTILYVFAAAIAAAISYRGIDVSVKMSVLLTVVSVPVVLVITIGTALTGNIDIAGQFSLDGVSFSSLFVGVAIGSAFFIGFESSAALAAETRDPKRVIPRAIMVIPMVLGMLYVLATIIQVPSLIDSAEELATGASPMAVLADRAGLSALSEITDLVIAIAVFASLIGFINFGSRIIVSTAADGLLPKRLTQVDPQTKSPTAAILFISVPALVGPLTLMLFTPATPLEIYGYVATLLVYFWVVPYMVVCVGAALLLIRSNSRFAILGLVTALMASAMVLWLLLNGVINPGASPLNAMPYLMVVTVVLFAAAFLASIRNTRNRSRA